MQLEGAQAVIHAWIAMYTACNLTLEFPSCIQPIRIGGFGTGFPNSLKVTPTHYPTEPKFKDIGLSVLLWWWLFDGQLSQNIRPIPVL